MNQYMIRLKGLALQLSKTRDNNRLINKFWRLLCQLKRLDNDKEFLDAFQEFISSGFMNFNYIYKKNIAGNFFPRENVGIGIENELPFTNSFRYEVRWLTTCFYMHAVEINEFIEFRKQFDIKVLKGQYKEGQLLLDEMRQQFGVSIWLYEAYMFINSKLGNEIHEMLELLPDNLHSYLIRCYAVKNISTVTYREYKKMAMGVLENIGDEGLKTYLQYGLLPLEYEMDEESILSLINYSRDVSLIDRYLLFSDILDVVATKNVSEDYRGVIKQYMGMLRDIHDEHLDSIRFCIDSTQNRRGYEISTDLLSAKEALIAGNINKSRELALLLLKERPYCVQAMDIIAEIDTRTYGGITYFENTLLQEILDNLHTIYSMKDGWKNCVNELNKLLNSCSKSNWARLVEISMIKSYGPIYDDDWAEIRRKEYLQYLDIETVCTCLPENEALDYLATVAEKNSYNMFRKEFMKKQHADAFNLVKDEEIQVIIEVCDTSFTVQERGKIIEKNIDQRSSFLVRALKYYFTQLNSPEYFLELLHYATELLIRNQDAALYVPWKKCIEQIENCDSEIRGEISVPILYYIQYKYGSLDTKDDVTLMCEDFLYYQGNLLPSELDIKKKKYSSEALVFFLRYVCVPDILSTALASKITTSLGLWQERIDICQKLCIQDVKNEKLYEEEIRTLTQRKKIYSELKIIEENRIHVNIEGIRENLLEKLEGEFVRYKLYSDSRYKDFMDSLVKLGGEPVIVLSADPERVLDKLIVKIRDAFVSSTEYGLDFTLSLSIRHGAIGDALRRPLGNEGLITVHDEDIDEHKWSYQLSDSITEVERKIIYDAIIQLNVDTELIISDLKEKYIQVRTEQSNEKGVFDYRIMPYEFQQLYYNAESMAECGEFIDFVFDYLWKKTEVNMKAMKGLLRSEILNRYRVAFDKVKEVLDNLEHSHAVTNLRQKIVTASNEMQNAVENVCFWFQRSTESKNQDFDLDFVFQMGYETICNMHPETKFIKTELKPFCTDGTKIAGQYLKSYSDIFYNLLDNIHKRATVHKYKMKNMKRIEYYLIQKDGRQCIYLQNDYDCTGDITKDKEKFAKLQQILDTDEYLEYVKGEGGTGIPKICKIIRKDLNRSGSISFGLKEKENKFFIEINI